MKMSTKLAAGLGVIALAVPSAAVAKPDLGDLPGPPDHAGPPADSGAPDVAGPPEHAGPPAESGAPDDAGKGKGKSPRVAYVFKGTYNSDGTIAVTKGNNHVRKAGLVGGAVEFDFTAAKVTVADFNGDGVEDLSDVQAGDSVVVMARLSKGDPGAQPYAARRLVDQTHEQEEDEVTAETPTP